MCSKEEFSARCNYDEVLLITRVLYGHIRLGRCTPRDFGQFGCTSDVTALFDARCSALRTCVIPPLDPALVSAEPECAQGLVVSLEASYVCIKGLNI